MFFVRFFFLFHILSRVISNLIILIIRIICRNSTQLGLTRLGQVNKQQNCYIPYPTLSLRCPVTQPLHNEGRSPVLRRGSSMNKQQKCYNPYPTLSLRCPVTQRLHNEGRSPVPRRGSSKAFSCDHFFFLIFSHYEQPLSFLVRNTNTPFLLNLINFGILSYFFITKFFVK